MGKLVLENNPPTAHHWNSPRYVVYTWNYPENIILEAESKKELRMKLAIAGLEVGKCISRPCHFPSKASWSRF